MSEFSNYRPSLECYGITKSPLDAYRGTGVKDNNAIPMDKSIKQKEQIAYYALDIAGNNVPIGMIPTMTQKLTLSEKEVEELKKKARSPSPCPCKSKECEEEYLKDKLKFETLLSKNVIPHASGIHMFRIQTRE